MAGTPIEIYLKYVADAKQAIRENAGLTKSVQALGTAAAKTTTEFAALDAAEKKAAKSSGNKSGGSSSGSNKPSTSSNKGNYGGMDTTTQLMRQNKVLSSAWKEGSNIIDRRYLRSISTLREAFGRFNEEAKHTAVWNKKFVGTLDDSSLQFTRFMMKGDLATRTLENMSSRFIDVGKNAQWTGRQMMVGITAPVAAIGALSVKAAMDIQELDVTLQRVLDTAGADDFKKLDDQTRELSVTFGTARAEIKGMQLEFARVGFGTDEIIQATKATQELSSLANVQVSDATNLTRVLRQGGLSWEDINDQMQKFLLIDNKTNLALGETIASLKDVYPVARQFGMSASETAAWMTAITVGGFDSADAARALRDALVKLPTALATLDLGGKDNGQRLKALKESLQELNKSTGMDLSLEKPNGDLKDGTELLLSYTAAMRNLLATGKTKDYERYLKGINAMFVKQGAPAGAQLIESVTKSMDPKSAKFQDLAKALDIALAPPKTFADEWAKQIAMITGSDAVKIKGQIQRLITSAQDLGTKLLPVAVKIMTTIGNVISRFGELSPKMQNFILMAAGGLAVLGPVIYVAAQSLLAMGTMFKGILTPAKLFFGMLRVKPVHDIGDMADDAVESVESLRRHFHRGEIDAEGFVAGLKNITNKTDGLTTATSASASASEAMTIAKETQTAASVKATEAILVETAAQERLRVAQSRATLNPATWGPAAGTRMRNRIVEPFREGYNSRKAARHAAAGIGSYKMAVAPEWAAPRDLEVADSLKSAVERRHEAWLVRKTRELSDAIGRAERPSLVRKPRTATDAKKQIAMGKKLAVINDKIAAIGDQDQILKEANRIAYTQIDNGGLATLRQASKDIRQTQKKLKRFEKAWGYPVPIHPNMKIGDKVARARDYTYRVDAFMESLASQVGGDIFDSNIINTVKSGQQTLGADLLTTNKKGKQRLERVLGERIQTQIEDENGQLIDIERRLGDMAHGSSGGIEEVHGMFSKAINDSRIASRMNGSDEGEIINRIVEGINGTSGSDYAEYLKQSALDGRPYMPVHAGTGDDRGRVAKAARDVAALVEGNVEATGMPQIMTGEQFDGLRSGLRSGAGRMQGNEVAKNFQRQFDSIMADSKLYSETLGDDDGPKGRSIDDSIRALRAGSKLKAGDDVPEGQLYSEWTEAMITHIKDTQAAVGQGGGVIGTRREGIKLKNQLDDFTKVVARRGETAEEIIRELENYDGPSTREAKREAGKLRSTNNEVTRLLSKVNTSIKEGYLPSQADIDDLNAATKEIDNIRQRILGEDDLLGVNQRRLLAASPKNLAAKPSPRLEMQGAQPKATSAGSNGYLTADVTEAFEQNLQQTYDAEWERLKKEVTLSPADKDQIRATAKSLEARAKASGTRLTKQVKAEIAETAEELVRVSKIPVLNPNSFGDTGAPNVLDDKGNVIKTGGASFMTPEDNARVVREALAKAKMRRKPRIPGRKLPDVASVGNTQANNTLNYGMNAAGLKDTDFMAAGEPELLKSYGVLSKEDMEAAAEQIASSYDPLADVEDVKKELPASALAGVPASEHAGLRAAHAAKYKESLALKKAAQDAGAEHIKRLKANFLGDGTSRWLDEAIRSGDVAAYAKAHGVPEPIHKAVLGAVYGGMNEGTIGKGKKGMDSNGRLGYAGVLKRELGGEDYDFEDKALFAVNSLAASETSRRPGEEIISAQEAERLGKKPRPSGGNMTSRFTNRAKLAARRAAGLDDVVFDGRGASSVDNSLTRKTTRNGAAQDYMRMAWTSGMRADKEESIVRDLRKRLVGARDKSDRARNLMSDVLIEGHRSIEPLRTNRNRLARAANFSSGDEAGEYLKGQRAELATSQGNLKVLTEASEFASRKEVLEGQIKKVIDRDFGYVTDDDLMKELGRTKAQWNDSSITNNADKNAALKQFMSRRKSPEQFALIQEYEKLTGVTSDSNATFYDRLEYLRNEAFRREEVSKRRAKKISDDIVNGGGKPVDIEGQIRDAIADRERKLTGETSTSNTRRLDAETGLAGIRKKRMEAKKTVAYGDDKVRSKTLNKHIADYQKQKNAISASIKEDQTFFAGKEQALKKLDADLLAEKITAEDHGKRIDGLAKDIETRYGLVRNTSMADADQMDDLMNRLRDKQESTNRTRTRSMGTLDKKITSAQSVLNLRRFDADEVILKSIIAEETIRGDGSRDHINTLRRLNAEAAALAAKKQADIEILAGFAALQEEADDINLKMVEQQAIIDNIQADFDSGTASGARMDTAGMKGRLATHFGAVAGSSLSDDDQVKDMLRQANATMAARRANPRLTEIDKIISGARKTIARDEEAAHRVANEIADVTKARRESLKKLGVHRGFVDFVDAEDAYRAEENRTLKLAEAAQRDIDAADATVAGLEGQVGEHGRRGRRARRQQKRFRTRSHEAFAGAPLPEVVPDMEVMNKAISTIRPGYTPNSGDFTMPMDSSVLVGQLTPETSGVIREMIVRQTRGSIAGVDGAVEDSYREAMQIVRMYHPNMPLNMQKEYAKSALRISTELSKDMDEAEALFGDAIIGGKRHSLREQQNLVSRNRGVRAMGGNPENVSTLDNMTPTRSLSLDQSVGENSDFSIYDLMDANDTSAAVDAGGQRGKHHPNTVPQESMVEQLISGSFDKDRAPGEVSQLLQEALETQGVEDADGNKVLPRHVRAAILDAAEDSVLSTQDAIDDLQGALELIEQEEKPGLIRSLRKRRKKAAGIAAKEMHNELRKLQAQRDELLSGMESLSADMIEINSGGIDDTGRPVRETTSFSSHDEYNQDRIARARAALDDEDILKKLTQEEVDAMKARLEHDLEEWNQIQDLRVREENARNKVNGSVADERALSNDRQFNRKARKKQYLYGASPDALTDDEFSDMRQMHLDDVVNNRPTRTYKRRDIEEARARRDIERQRMAYEEDLYTQPELGEDDDLDVIGTSDGPLHGPAAPVDLIDVPLRGKEPRPDMPLKKRIPAAAGESAKKFGKAAGSALDDVAVKAGKDLSKVKGGLLNTASWLNPITAARKMGKGTKKLAGGISKTATNVVSGSGMLNVLPEGAAKGVSMMVGSLGPLLLILVAVAAIVAVLALNFKKWWKQAKSGWEELKKGGLELWHAVLDPIRGVFIKLFGDNKKGGKGMHDAWKNVGKGIGKVFSYIGRALEAIAPIIEFIMEYIVTFIYVIVKSVQAIIAIFTGDWSKLGDIMKEIWGAIWGYIVNLAISALQLVLKGLALIPKGIINMFGGILSAIPDGVKKFLHIEGWKEKLDEANTWVDKFVEKTNTSLDGMKHESFSDWGKKGGWGKNDKFHGKDGFFKKIGKKWGESMQDGMDEAGPLEPPALTEAAQEGTDYVKDFVSTFRDKMGEVVAGWKEAALSAFDDYAKKRMDAVEAKKKAIDDEIKAEQKRDEDLDYLAKKEEIRNKRRRDNLTYLTSKNIAIYEGRYDDAKMLQAEHRTNMSDSDKEDKDVDKDREKVLTNRLRDAAKERIEIEAEELKKTLDLRRGQLEAQLNAMTEFIPKNVAEAERMHAAIQGAMLSATGGYGAIGKAQAENWNKGWSDAWNKTAATVNDEMKWSGTELFNTFAKALNIDVSSTVDAGVNGGGESALHAGAGAVGNELHQGAGPTTRTKHHTGGHIGPSNSNPYDIPATLQSGEYVIQRKAVQKIGHGYLDEINKGEKPTFHTGGPVGKAAHSFMHGTAMRAVNEWATGKASMNLGGKKFSADDYKASMLTAYANAGYGQGGAGADPDAAPGEYASGLNKVFLERFHQWNAALGGKFSIGSGFRTMAEQAVLYDKWLRKVPGQAQAAPPGKSMHNYGLAIDLDPSSTSVAERKLGDKYKLYWPMGFEPWHVQPIEAKEWRALMQAGAGVPTAGATNQYSSPSGLQLTQGLFKPATGDAAYGATSPVAAGPLGRILKTIRAMESGGNYRAESPYSSASGAYQFINSTWGNYKGYPTASSAPPAIQDERAGNDVRRFLDMYNNDLRAVPGNWYSPATFASGKWDVPMGEGNPLTMRMYIDKWLNKYNTVKMHKGGMVFPSMDVGGHVYADGIAKVHAGETVVTRQLTEALAKSGGVSNVGGNNTELHLHFEGGFFGSDRELMKLQQKMEKDIIPKIQKAKGLAPNTYSGITKK